MSGKGPMEDRIEGLEGKVAELEAELNLFLKPLLIKTCNELSKPSPQYAYSTPPGVMVWVKDQFRYEKDKIRKRFLAGLYERLKKEIPAAGDMGELKVEPEPDLSDIFNR